LQKLSNFEAQISAPSSQLESLEEFHVFVLCHVIKRPIIIVADKWVYSSDGEPFAHNHFGGIYLPLECDAENCCRYPLVLTYYAGHFSALALMQCKMDEQSPYPVFPLTYSSLEMLPIKFAADPGVECDWNQLEQHGIPIVSKLDQLHLLHKFLDLVLISNDKEQPRIEHLSMQLMI
jgi:hypothetical protein